MRARRVHRPEREAHRPSGTVRRTGARPAGRPTRTDDPSVRVAPRARRGALRVGLAAATGLLGGCSRSPSQNILGSFFPSWMLCLGLGLLAAVACRLVFGRIGFRDDVPVPLLTYLALAFAVTCLVWLLWFGH